MTDDDQAFFADRLAALALERLPEAEIAFLRAAFERQQGLSEAWRVSLAPEAEPAFVFRSGKAEQPDD